MDIAIVGRVNKMQIFPILVPLSLGVLLGVGCKNESPRESPHKAPITPTLWESPATNGTAKSAKEKKTPLSSPAKDSLPNKSRQEAERLELLTKEYDSFTPVTIEHNTNSLDDKEKSMLAHLVTASQIVDELNMLQIHRNNLIWKKQIDTTGEPIEKKIFYRYHAPWCQQDISPQCNALASKPPRSRGWIHWPDDFTKTEHAKLSASINAKELRSPFTFVRRSDKNRYEAIPYSQSRELGPLMARLSRELISAASFAPNKSLKRFLETRASALLSNKPFPYDSSDYDWIAVEGDWEVTVGPYETYGNPFKQKALFQMYIGKVNNAVSRELQVFKSNLQAMEDALSVLLGPEIYKSRKMDSRIAIRAMDTWMAAGDGRKGKGAVVAYHLPNRGPSVEEGLYKKVIMVNHAMAFASVSTKRAKEILVSEQIQFVDGKADLMNTTFHELAHGFGAYHEMKITDVKGRATTIKDALKEYDSLFEELKADGLGLWLLSFQKSSGRVSDLDMKKRYTSALIHTLGLFQYPLSDTYTQMAAMKIGWYMEQGAIIWNESTFQFTINYEKMQIAVESLAKLVSTIQLQGDHKGADGLYSKYIQSAENGDISLVTALDDIRKKMVNKFRAADIKSPSLQYSITGIN